MLQSPGLLLLFAPHQRSHGLLDLHPGLPTDTLFLPVSCGPSYLLLLGVLALTSADLVPGTI